MDSHVALLLPDFDTCWSDRVLQTTLWQPGWSVDGRPKAFAADLFAEYGLGIVWSETDLPEQGFTEPVELPVRVCSDDGVVDWLTQEEDHSDDPHRYELFSAIAKHGSEDQIALVNSGAGWETRWEWGGGADFVGITSCEYRMRTGRDKEIAMCRTVMTRQEQTSFWMRVDHVESVEADPVRTQIWRLVRKLAYAAVGYQMGKQTLPDFLNVPEALSELRSMTGLSFADPKGERVIDSYVQFLCGLGLSEKEAQRAVDTDDHGFPPIKENHVRWALDIRLHASGARVHLDYSPLLFAPTHGAPMGTDVQRGYLEAARALQNRLAPQWKVLPALWGEATQFNCPPLREYDGS